VAKPTKRRIEPGDPTTGTVRSGNPKVAAAAAARKAEGLPTDDTRSSTSRYTPRVIDKKDLPSPPWVPIVMFALFAVGVLAIFLNYTGVLPSSPNTWYLVVGLVAILGGIVTATQYR
jgi:hypothetical protein